MRRLYGAFRTILFQPGTWYSGNVPDIKRLGLPTSVTTYPVLAPILYRCAKMLWLDPLTDRPLDYTNTRNNAKANLGAHPNRLTSYSSMQIWT